MKFIDENPHYGTHTEFIMVETGKDTNLVYGGQIHIYGVFGKWVFHCFVV